MTLLLARLLNPRIKAGFLSTAIWLFAHIFYRHRQRR